LSRIEEDGKKWLRRPKLCTKSCTAVLRRRSIAIIQYIYAVPSVIFEAVVSKRRVEGSVMQMFRRKSKQWQLKENEWLVIA
jgi:hypothetical protein